MMNNLQPHPFAEYFPKMNEEEYASFKDDIAQNGVREAIMLFQDKILDGLHRYRAASETGQSFKTMTFHGSEQSALDYVIAINANRRHLKKSQLAMVAAALVTTTHGGDRKSNHQNDDMIFNRDSVATRFGVSTASVDRARQVLASGEQDIIAAVRNGEWGFPEALEEIKERITEREEEARRLAEERERERLRLEAEFNALNAIYDTTCIPLFATPEHEGIFRAAVLSEDARRFIPREQQKPLAEYIIAGNLDISLTIAQIIVDARKAQAEEDARQAAIAEEKKAKELYAAEIAKIDELSVRVSNTIEISITGVSQLSAQRDAWSYPNEPFPGHTIAKATYLILRKKADEYFGIGFNPDQN